MCREEVMKKYKFKYRKIKLDKFILFCNFNRKLLILIENRNKFTIQTITHWQL